MNKIKEIIIGTNNAGKYKEICELLPKDVIKHSPKEFDLLNPEETGKTFKECFFTFLGNKLHISLYFPSLLVPTKISLILFISH